MEVPAILIGLILIAIVLNDTFESIIMPRTVTRKIRLTRLFYQITSRIWGAMANRMPDPDRRESFLGIYGPLSLLMLLTTWAVIQIVGFALVQWGLRQPFNGPEPMTHFGSHLYLSGVTFFTLGFGDFTPRSPLGRFLSVGEAGVGFGFLAIVIGYLPVIYQSFSRREVGILLLDARAGSPSSAAELLLRHAEAGCMEELTNLLKEWEHWAADLLESHLSYPMLTTYRSQHDRQSWLGALTTIMDTCTLIRIGFQGTYAWEPRLTWQAHMTFAMARHAVIDLALILNSDPTPPKTDRLPPEQAARLWERLRQAGIPLHEGEAANTQLAIMRRSYESYVHALGQSLILDIPPWLIENEGADNWERSYWESLRHL